MKNNTTDYDELKSIGTGSHDELDNFKIITYPFDRYQIKVKLTPNNEFIGITEIKINKDFLSHKQRMATLGFHDVEEFYRDE
jgi:hypothetical protein